MKPEVYTEANMDYLAFLKDSFQKLNKKSTPALVIDLRDNNGGTSQFAKALFAHLTDGPFKWLNGMKVKKYEYDFFRHTDLPPERRRMPRRFAQPNDDGWLDMTRHPNLGTQQPASPGYSGQVYVLINGLTSSAAAQFVSIAHSRQRATLIGEEGDIDRFGTNAGWIPILILPNTRICVQVPVMRSWLAVSGDPTDRRILPDRQVRETVDDMLAIRDPAMKVALAIAAGKEKAD
jgi:C-terminal processing protease CtpA/Prc